MRVSVGFICHLIGFGLLSASLISGFILDSKIRKETEPQLQLFTGRIAKTIGLLTPVAALLLLATGIANINNFLVGSTKSWYDEGWLVAKIVLFAVMLVNGTFYGPKLARSRMKLITEMAEGSARPSAEDVLRSCNRQITLYYLVQTLLILFILYLSVFGPGKHPGNI
jgi:uncharacterized membrane protein